MEILTSEQVFEDLDDIKNIREKTGGDGDGAYKSLIMAMTTRSKKKKKNRWSNILDRLETASRECYF